jgi:hypothetical protein
VQVRRPVQGDDPILEQWAHSDTALGWGGMNSDSGFKAKPVAFQEVQRVHPGGHDTPVVIEDWGGLFAIIEVGLKSFHTRLICAFVGCVHFADHTPSVGST